MSKQDEALAAMGVDVNDLPDNLETTKLQAVCDALGIDTSDMTDNLKSSYYEQIANEYTGGGGGGVNVLNENGIIKQQHLPDGYPYETPGDVFTQEMINNATESVVMPLGDNGGEWTYSLKKVSNEPYAAENFVGAVFSFNGYSDSPIAEDSIWMSDDGKYIIVYDAAFSVFEDTEVNGVPISKGLWLVDYSEWEETLELRIPATLKPIAHKYLPAGYPYAEPTVFLPETEPVFSADMGGFIIMSGLDADMFIVGQSYTVNWNGTNYETRAQLSSDNGMNAIILGDMGAMQGVPTTGEPFVVMILDAAAQAAMGIAAMVIPIDGSASVTLSIIGEILTPVDAKFLPNATVFVDVYGTIGGTYANSDSEKPENISKQSHTNAEILALAKMGKNVIIRNYDSETGTAFKCYNLSEVDFTFASFTNAYFGSTPIGGMITVLINGTISMHETRL
jgi:hypothetical protein